MEVQSPLVPKGWEPQGSPRATRTGHRAQWLTCGLRRQPAWVQIPAPPCQVTLSKCPSCLSFHSSFTDGDDIHTNIKGSIAPRMKLITTCRVLRRRPGTQSITSVLTENGVNGTIFSLPLPSFLPQDHLGPSAPLPLRCFSLCGEE